MTFRIYLANANARRVAEIGQALSLDGTVTDGCLGFGAWGIESTVIVEVGDVTREELHGFVAALFADYPNEEAVYVAAVGSAGEIWWRDGRVT